jgi:ribosomal protein L22
MTEKDYNPEQKMNKVAKKQAVAVPKPTEAPKKEEKVEKNKDEKNAPQGRTPKNVENISTGGKEKKPVKKVEEKKIKKTEAVVNVTGLPISTKYASSICKFIKYKKINDAISDLEQVIAKKKAVPMKGEIPHRKGRIMSGRFPKKASENFIVLLKSLLGNANANGLDEPIIVEAIPNMGARPFGRFGKVKRKRTHVRIKVIEKKLVKRSSAYPKLKKIPRGSARQKGAKKSKKTGENK